MARGCSNNSTLKSTSVRETFSQLPWDPQDFLLSKLIPVALKQQEMIVFQQRAFTRAVGRLLSWLRELPGDTKGCELGCLLSRASVLFSDFSLHENSLVFNSGFQVWKQWFLVSGVGDTSA